MKKYIAIYRLKNSEQQHELVVEANTIRDASIQAIRTASQQADIAEMKIKPAPK